MAKKILIVMLILLTFTLSGYYSGTTTEYGDTGYYNGSDGYQMTYQRYGDQVYYSDSNGNNGTMTTYGNTTYTTEY